MAESVKREFYYTDDNASQMLANYLIECSESIRLKRSIDKFNKINVICIGTDLVTGDSLGPRVGSILSQDVYPGISVFGTMSNPIHGTNILELIDEWDKENPDTLTIAIDACLGRSTSLGKIQVYEGGIFPGAGMGRCSRPVGDIAVAAIVTYYGFSIVETHALVNNIPLSFIEQMTSVISTGMLKIIKEAQSAKVC
jgi:putative sporulation protein YyaC